MSASLFDLARGIWGRVVNVEDCGANDIIARRLRDLGFVAGEPVRVVATGPIAREPVVVQIGATRFAMRRAEAQRVRVELSHAPS